MTAKRLIGVALAAAALATVSGCGSSSSSSTTSEGSGGRPAAATPSGPPNGAYVAKMTTPALKAAGVDTVAVGNAGTWKMSIDGKRVSLKPPYHDASAYRVVSLTANKLTVAGNPQCS